MKKIINFCNEGRFKIFALQPHAITTFKIIYFTSNTIFLKDMFFAIKSCKNAVYRHYLTMFTITTCISHNLFSSLLFSFSSSTSTKCLFMLPSTLPHIYEIVHSDFSSLQGLPPYVHKYLNLARYYLYTSLFSVATQTAMAPIPHQWLQILL